MDFTDRTVVVTGAASGIGAATAERFLEYGAQVVRLDIAEAPGSVDMTNAMPGAMMDIRCDVSKSDEVAAAFQRIVEHFGGVDVLVNNAGIQIYATVTETSEEDWDRIQAVNVKGAFLCAKAAIPAMGEKGVIVNVSSVQGMMSETSVAAYATSKAALLGLTRSIAVDYAPEIRCVAVCPGSVDTPLLEWAIRESGDRESVMEQIRAMHLTRRSAKPEEIAAFITFLSSDDASFITGHPYRIDGGIGVQIGTILRE